MMMVMDYPAKKPDAKVKILIDADLILELFLNRSEFIENAEHLLDIQSKYQNIQMYITDQCLNKVYTYLSVPEIQVGEDAVASIKKMFSECVVPVTSNHIEQSRLSSVKDFDSSVEVACAVEMACDAVVTNHAQNFENSTLPIWSIEELDHRLMLKQLKHLKQMIQHDTYEFLRSTDYVNHVTVFRYITGHCADHIFDITEPLKRYYPFSRCDSINPWGSVRMNVMHPENPIVASTIYHEIFSEMKPPEINLCSTLTTSLFQSNLNYSDNRTYALIRKSGRFGTKKIVLIRNRPSFLRS